MDSREPLSDEMGGQFKGVRYTIATVLTAVAGFVDIFVYLSLYHVFVANMSGNSIDLGLHLVQRDWSQVFHRTMPIATFVAGLIACGLAIEIARRCGARRVLGVTLAIEALSLAGLLSLGMWMLGTHHHPAAEPGAGSAALVAIGAFAMGIQNASLRAAGVLNVYTTHVTGTLTRMSQRLVQYVFWLRDHARHGGSSTFTHPLEHPLLQQALRLATLWLAYTGGAALGGWSWMDMGMISLLGPIAAIGVIAGLAFFRPVPLVQ